VDRNKSSKTRLGRHGVWDLIILGMNYSFYLLCGVEHSAVTWARLTEFFEGDESKCYVQQIVRRGSLLLTAENQSCIAKHKLCFHYPLKKNKSPRDPNVHI
jgi:hypothetical protein